MPSAQAPAHSTELEAAVYHRDTAKAGSFEYSVRIFAQQLECGESFGAVVPAGHKNHPPDIQFEDPIVAVAGYGQFSYVRPAR